MAGKKDMAGKFEYGAPLDRSIFFSFAQNGCLDIEGWLHFLLGDTSQSSHYYFETMMNIQTIIFIYLASAIAMPASGNDFPTHPLPHPTQNHTTLIENPPAVAPDGNPPQTMLRRGDRRSLAISSEDEHHPDKSYLLVRPHLTVDCCIVHAIHLIL